MTNVVDPLGGSYFVEALTDEMERQAEAYFAQIAEYGGVIEAIEAGFFQREIAEASYRYQRSIETQGSHHRRRQRLRARREPRKHRPAQDHRGDGARAGARGAAACARTATRTPLRRTLERLQAACRDPEGQPHAASHRLRQCLLHRRRDRRSDGGRLRTLYRTSGALMPHKHGIRCRTDIELYRMRRTLARVVRKLEEALALEPPSRWNS